MLWNDGSNTDMVFAEAIKAMCSKESRLMQVKTSTFGVGPEELPVLSCIEVPVMFISKGPKDEQRFTSTMIKWPVVDVPSSNNAIVSRRTQTTVHMKTDIKYLIVTFKTDAGDVVIYVDQRKARCYSHIGATPDL